MVSGVLLRVACCGKYIFMDESPILGNIVNFFENRTVIPSHFSYPTLFSYLAAIPTGLGSVVLHMRGILPSPADIWALFTLDSILPILPARLTSVFFGTATILATFEIGRRFFNIKTGLIAAALISYSRLHIGYSSYALPDVTTAFFCALSLFFALSALRTKLVREYVFAGIFAGFAVSTKYNSALMIFPLLFVHLIQIYDEGRFLSPRAWVNIRIISTGLAFLCSFLIGSPGWLLRPGPFWEALFRERMHMATGHLGSYGLPYVRHMMLLWGWEKTVAILFGLGLVYAIFRRDRENTVFLALVLPSFLFIGIWQKKDLHYLLFMYPALALLSGRLFSDVLLKSCSRTRNLAVLLLLISAFVWPLSSSAIYAYQQTLEDSRWVASRWIQENIQENSRIVTDWAYLPMLLTKQQKDKRLNGRHREFYMARLLDIHTYQTIPLVYSKTWLKEIKADYLITSSYCFERFFRTPAPYPGSGLSYEYSKRKETYDALFHNRGALGWSLLKEFHTRKGPRILLYIRCRGQA